MPQPQSTPCSPVRTLQELHPKLSSSPPRASPLRSAGPVYSFKKGKERSGGGGSIDEMFRCSFMTPHHFLPSHWTCALAPERHMRVVKVTLAAMRDLSQIMFGSNDILLLLMWMGGRCQTGDADLCGWVASTSSPLHSLGLAVCIYFLLLARAVVHETALLQILYRHFPR